MSSLEPSDDGFVGFMDAETATFASRIRRLMRSKVEELQTSSPSLDSGMLTHMPEAAMCAAWITQYIHTDRRDEPSTSLLISWQSCCPDILPLPLLRCALLTLTRTLTRLMLRRMSHCMYLLSALSAGMRASTRVACRRLCHACHQH